MKRQDNKRCGNKTTTTPKLPTSQLNFNQKQQTYQHQNHEKENQ